MVTLALAAVLLTVAVPSFLAYQRNSELTSTANNFIAALNAARTEAMKRNLNAMVIPSNKDTDWSKGWTVFVDVDRNNTFDSGTDIVIFQQDAPLTYISLSGVGTAAESPLSYIMYDASGFSKTNTGGFGASTVQISRNDASATDFAQIRRIKISSVGRVRVCTPKSATDASCSATNDS